MRVAGLLLVVSLLAGCTHRHSLGDGRGLLGESVDFSAQPGFVEEGEVVEVEGRVVVRGERGDFELTEIKTIREIRRARGAWEGLRIGFPVGFVAGAVYGFADETDSHFDFSAPERAVLAGIFIGVLGGLVGLVVGAVRGSRYVYTVGP